MKNPTRRIYDHQSNHSSSYWNRANAKQKSQRLIKLFIAVIILFALGNLLVRLPGWVGNLNQPFGNIQTNIAVEGKVNGEYRTNILLISVSERNSLQDVALASLSSSRESVTFLRIPRSPKMYSSGVDQDMSLSAAYFSKPYRDSEFDSLYLSVKELLALPIDGYFVFVENDLKFDENGIRSIHGKINSFRVLPKFFSYKSWLNENMKTNYAVGSLWSLAWDFRKVNDDKLYFVNLDETVDSKQFSLSDIDSLLRENLVDTGISNEQAVIEIVGENITLVIRVINNIGGSTLNFSNNTEESKTKVILGSDKNKAAQRIAGFLNVEVEKKEIESGADIKVVVSSQFEVDFYGQ